MATGLCAEHQAAIDSAECPRCFMLGQDREERRDRFAGFAMQGMIAAVENANATADERAFALARRSYEIADAMLAAREAKKEGT